LSNTAVYKYVFAVLALVLVKFCSFSLWEIREMYIHVHRDPRRYPNDMIDAYSEGRKERSIYEQNFRLWYKFRRVTYITSIYKWHIYTRIRKSRYMPVVYYRHTSKINVKSIYRITESQPSNLHCRSCWIVKWIT
jgi:hypothetical protein